MTDRSTSEPGLRVLDPRAGRYVVRTGVEIVSIVFIAVAVVAGLLHFSRDSTAFFTALAVVATGFIVLFVAGYAAFKRLVNLIACVLTSRRAVEVALDEGGLRFSARSGLTYWPLDELDEPLVIGRWFGRVDLVLTHQGAQQTERVVVFHAAGIADAQRFAREVERRIEALRRDLPPGAQQLERSGEDLETWRERIEGSVHADSGGGAFRSAALGRDELVILARDVQVPPAVRAAAAYALLHAAPDDAPALLSEVLSEASPPLWVAMIALASTDKRIVSNERLAAALPYVDEEIQEAVLDATRSR